jgi:hypothetical protein
MKKRISVSVLVLLVSLIVTSIAGAQYSNPWWTTYQVVNMGDQPANITVDYYDSDGNVQTAAQKTFTNVPAGASRLVVQYTDDADLGDGTYSAVISADQPIAAITNQELAPSGAGSYQPEPPFATYSGQSSGDTEITLPAVMYNWYGYYTEIYIQNVGGGEATNVDITYVPGVMDVGSGLEPTGASGVTDNDNSIARYASLHKSQEEMSSLGTPSGSFAGRFLGTAVITSDEPIVAVVNQHNTDDYKLMTYNGFASGATEIAAPSYMRGYYGYYTTLLIANPDVSATANVTVTYMPNTSETYYNEAAPGSTIGTATVNHTVNPQTTLTRYDGPGATDGQSDLDDHDETGHAFTKFFGAVKVESDIPVMVQVNVEAEASGDAQGGAYNGILVNEASENLVAPVILADYYGYYTTMIVQNTTNTGGSCNITYTSDDTYSAVKNHSETYTHTLPANGSFTVYEGRKGGQEVGDINSDAAWRLSGNMQFIGAASLSCNVPVVAFVNEESDISGRDSMYTMNTFSK